MEKDRLIFHVDVNSAFLSWEAARRVAEGGEDLRLIPSCIGGDPAKRTSIVTAKSIPAKKLGIRTGEPISMALRKCPDLVIARSDFQLYTKNSRAFMDICREYTPTLEKYSIDECFLDMSGMEHIYPDPIATAHEIKDRIRDTLGFTVNIGIGPNKLLAKMAGDFEKPDKVHTLFYEEIPSKMWPLPVRELISVGKNTADKLIRSHIHTIGDLAAMDIHALQALIGMKFGLQLHNYANGIDDSPVISQAQEAKSYSVATTLEENVITSDRALQILHELSDHVAFRIRTDHARAYCVGITIRGTNFKDRSHQRHLEEATDITTEIYEIATALFQELWDGSPIRLLSLSLSDVTREDMVQLSLFPDETKEKNRKLDRAMDDIRKRYGLDTITRGFPTDSHVGRKHRAQFENRREQEHKSRPGNRLEPDGKSRSEGWREPDGKDRPGSS